MRTDDDLRSALRPKRGLRRFAIDRHRDLRVACDELLRAVDDPHRFATKLHELEVALRDHLSAEEDLLIPAFQLTDPEEGDAVRTKHARIRECLAELGVTEVSERTHLMRRLGHLLDETFRHEETTLYAWAEDNVSAVMRRQIYVRISHWLRRRAASD